MNYWWLVLKIAPGLCILIVYVRAFVRMYVRACVSMCVCGVCVCFQKSNEGQIILWQLPLQMADWAEIPLSVATCLAWTGQCIILYELEKKYENIVVRNNVGKKLLDCKAVLLAWRQRGLYTSSVLLHYLPVAALPRNSSSILQLLCLLWSRGTHRLIAWPPCAMLIIVQWWTNNFTNKNASCAPDLRQMWHFHMQWRSKIQWTLHTRRLFWIDYPNCTLTWLHPCLYLLRN